VHPRPSTHTRPHTPIHRLAHPPAHRPTHRDYPPTQPQARRQRFYIFYKAKWKFDAFGFGAARRSRRHPDADRRADSGPASDGPIRAPLRTGRFGPRVRPRFGRMISASPFELHCFMSGCVAAHHRIGSCKPICNAAHALRGKRLHRCRRSHRCQRLHAVFCLVCINRHSLPRPHVVGADAATSAMAGGRTCPHPSPRPAGSGIVLSTSPRCIWKAALS
jgi:hypothetical protein